MPPTTKDSLSAMYLPLDVFVGNDSDIVFPGGARSSARHPSPQPVAVARTTPTSRYFATWLRLNVRTPWHIFVKTVIVLASIWCITLAFNVLQHAFPGHYGSLSTAEAYPWYYKLHHAKYQALKFLENLNAKQLVASVARVARLNDFGSPTISLERDLLLYGTKAEIVFELTTSPPSGGLSRLNPFKSSPPPFDPRSALDIFADPPVLGDCWRFPGFNGHVGIRLDYPANITAIAIGYPPHDRLLESMTIQAPKMIRLWGRPTNLQTPDCAASEREISQFSNSRRLPNPLRMEDRLFLLSELEYSVSILNAKQVFPIFGCNTVPFDVVIVEVVGNWGGDETCVYHIGLYGSNS